MPSRTEKKWLAAGAILALAVVVLIATVQLRRATTETLAAFAARKGRIDAIEHTVALERPGTIEKFLVATGQIVEPGQTAALVSTAELETGLREAEAELRKARDERQRAAALVAQRESEVNQALVFIAQREKELASSARNLERLQSLFNKDLIARQEVEKERAAKQTIEAQLAVESARRQTAEASLRAAEAQADRQELAIRAAVEKIQRLKRETEENALRSPVRGRVRLLVQPGQALPAGAKVLTVLPLEDVYMTVLLPDSQAVHVAVGSEARVVLDGTPEDILPASVFSVSGGSQPKEDEKQATQDKVVSRVKVKIDPRPLAKVQHVGPGSPGAVYLRLDSKTAWPDRLPAVDRE